MKHIRTKIVVVVLGLTLLASISMGAIGVAVTRNVTEVTVSEVMNETAVTVAHNAQNTFLTYTLIVTEIATNEIFTDTDATDIEKKYMIDKKVEQYYMRSGSLLTLAGEDVFSGESYAGEIFFEKSMAGETYMSTPYISQDASDKYVVVSAPIMRNGVVTGVLYFECDTYVLQRVIDDGTIGETGDCYILDKNGTTIAYGDENLVLSQSNAITESANAPQDAELAQLAEVERKMIAGETGFAKYPYEGTTSWQSYLPIEGTDGWSLAVIVDESEVMADANEAALIIIGISTTIFLVGLTVAIKMGNSMSTPIMACVERLTLMGQGDLTSPMPVVKSSDEIGTFARVLGDMLDNQRQMVSDVSRRLSKIAAGNLATEQNVVTYGGDFIPVEQALDEIQKRLRGVITDITATADQVAIGAQQVAVGANALAHTTNQQVDAVENILGSMKGIQEVATRISGDADHAIQLSGDTAEKLTESRVHMSKLLGAVEDIRQQSGEISKIIKTIDDIAFQTNILALNAAVEAARAGNAGKGFAVVADEVRNLASKSAMAARETSELIAGSVTSAENVAEVAAMTSRALEEVTQHSENTAEHMAMITNDILGQNVSIDSVNDGVQNISDTIHADSATSQQSAATSKILADNAEFLKKMVSAFVVDDADPGPMPDQDDTQQL